MNYGLGYLAGPLPLSLSINSPFQVVGGTPTYRLSGAPPGAQITWTSFKDGIPTGEDMAGYAGQIVEANGTAELQGGPWTEPNVGRWIKQVRITAPDGSVSQALVEFDVVSAQASGGVIIPAGSSTQGSFLSQPLPFLPSVTWGTGLLAVGALWLLTKKK